MHTRSVVVIAVVALISFAAFGLLYGVISGPRLRQYRQVGTLQVSDVNLTQVPDGEYRGEFRAGRLFVAVRVAVSGGSIREIVLLPGGSRGKNFQQAGKILERILGAQTPNVEIPEGVSVVQGKALCKAVENALRQSAVLRRPRP